MSSKLQKVEDLVDMTAMVDIVFFVLIFFMVTSMEGVYSSIVMPAPDPQETAAKGKLSLSTVEADKDFVIVRIDKDNTVWLNDSEISSEQELLVRLREARKGPSAPSRMLVLGNSEATHGKVVMVLDAGHDAGIDDVKLAVDDES